MKVITDGDKKYSYKGVTLKCERCGQVQEVEDNIDITTYIYNGNTIISGKCLNCGKVIEHEYWDIME